MKSRDTLKQLRQFNLNEKKRQVMALETMMRDFTRLIDELDRQIKFEEEKSGISDITHFAYPTFAKAALQRKENLMVSMNDIKEKCDRAREDLESEYEEMKKFEVFDSKESSAFARQQNRAEQAEMDEIAARGAART